MQHTKRIWPDMASAADFENTMKESMNDLETPPPARAEPRWRAFWRLQR
jgi:hypothetical protein